MITLVASVSAIRGGPSSAIDTTGANLLIASTGNAFAAATFSDSKGNTWIPLTLHVGGGNGYHRFFYCFTPIVGTGHTFTPAGSYASCIVYAYAGVLSYQTESGNGIGSNTPPIASGSVTPSADGALVITGLTANTYAVDTVTPAGFTQTTINNGPGVNLQNSAAWLIQSVAAAINPTWDWSGGSHDYTGVSTAVFLPAEPPPLIPHGSVTYGPTIRDNTAFVGFDTTTLGEWSPTYGNSGRAICNDGEVPIVAGTVITVTQGSTFTWDSNPSATRALRRLSLTGRIASCWNHGTAVKITATGTVGTHRLSLYFVDWDFYGPRAATINVYNNDTNALLDTRSISSAMYAAGVWGTWEFSGNTRWEIVNVSTGTSNATVSGWFLDTIGEVPPSGAARVTQIAAELLTHPLPVGRITQAAVDTITRSPSDGRITQAVAQTITKPPPSPGRITQIVVQTLTGKVPSSLPARLTQSATELLSTPGTAPPVAVTQSAAELLSTHPASDARISQVAAELISTQPATQARLSQFVVELLAQEGASSGEVGTSTIPSGSLLYPPSVPTPATIGGAFIPSGSVPHPPFVTLGAIGILNGTIPSTVVVYPPSVTQVALTVGVPHIQSTALPYPPTVTLATVFVIGAHIPTGSVVVNPPIVWTTDITVTQVAVETLSTPFPDLHVSQLAVDVLTVPFASSVRVSHLVVETISALPPDLEIEVAFIPPGSIVDPPRVVAGIATDHIPSTAVLYPPTVWQEGVTTAFIPSHVQLFPPSVEGGDKTILLPLIGSTGRRFAPGVYLFRPQPTGKLIANYITFVKQGGVGVQAITGVRFRGKALLIWTTRLTGHGTALGSQQHLGMTDGIAQSCRFIHHPGSETATTSAQCERVDSLVWLAPATVGTGFNTPDVQGVFQSWNDDGFTIDWVVNDGAPTVFHALVMGGDDEIQVAVKQVKITQGQDETLVVTGVGFYPDSFIVIGGATDEFGHGGAPTSYSIGAPFGSLHGFGFSNAVDNVCSWTLGRGTGGAADSKAGLHNNRVASIRTANLGGGEELCGIQITAAFPDGFTVMRRDPYAGHTPIQHILCIKGAAFKFGIFSSPPTVGMYTIPLDFEAGLALVQTHGSSNLSTTGINGLHMMIGAWVTKIGQGGTWIRGTDDASPSVYKRASYTDQVIQVRREDTLAVTCQAAITETTETGLTVWFSEVPRQPITFIFIVLGSIIPAIPPEVLLTPATVGLTWTEFTSRDNVMRPWSTVALPDPLGYYGGFKEPRVIQWGRIVRALSEIRSGQMEGMEFTVTLSDSDRLIRQLLSQTTTKYFVNRPMVVRMIDDESRRALGTPRTVMRGLVSAYQPQPQLQFQMTAQDVMTRKFAQSQAGVDVPKRLISVDDFPNSNQIVPNFTPGSGIPSTIGATGKGVPIIYGSVKDQKLVTIIDPPVPVVPPFDPDPNWQQGTQWANDIHGAGILNGGVGGYGLPYHTVGGIGYLGRIRGYFAGTVDYDRAVSFRWNPVPGAESYYWIISDGGGWYMSYPPPPYMTFARLVIVPISPMQFPDADEGQYQLVFGYPTQGIDLMTPPPPGVGTTSHVVDEGKGEIKPIYVGDAVFAGVTWRVGLVCGHAIKGITGAYLNDKAIDLTTNPEWLTPVNWAWWISMTGSFGWDWTKPYLDIGVAPNVHRYTLIFLRGLAGDTFAGITPAADGSPGVTINVDGIETNGDGTGTLITNIHEQYKHCMKNWILGNYTTGAWLTAPVYPDIDAVPQLDEASFDAVTVIAASRIAGGYLGAGIIGVDGEVINIRDLIARWNQSGDVDCGFNRLGQFFIAMIPNVATAVMSAVQLTDVHDVHRDTFQITDDLSSHFNNMPWSYERNYSGRATEEHANNFKHHGELSDDQSIMNYEARLRAPELELELVRDEHTAMDIVQRRLLRMKDPPRRVSFAIGIEGANYELGQIVNLTHYGGVGATGWVGQPVRISRHEFDPNRLATVLECEDMKPFLATVFILGDETALPATWVAATTDAQRIYGYLGDETTEKFSDGESAKRLR